VSSYVVRIDRTAQRLHFSFFVTQYPYRKTKHYKRQSALHFLHDNMAAFQEGQRAGATSHQGHGLRPAATGDRGPGPGHPLFLNIHIAKLNYKGQSAFHFLHDNMAAFEEGQRAGATSHQRHGLRPAATGNRGPGPGHPARAQARALHLQCGRHLLLRSVGQCKAELFLCVCGFMHRAYT
jgi:hypothetical protein